jgi:hypothetical protein
MPRRHDAARPSAARIHHIDQKKAAQRELDQAIPMISAALGGGRPGRLTPAIDLVIRRHGAATRMGQGSACRHITGSPMPRFAAAHLPGTEVCSRCISVLRPSPAEDHRCDGCGRIRFGQLTCGQARLGLVLLGYGMCPDCLAGAVAVTR